MEENHPNEMTTTLKIKTFPIQSAKVVTIKILCCAKETIGQIQRLLAQTLSPYDKSCFELRSLYPMRTHAQTELTLEEAGLVPNANLILHKTGS